MTDRPILFSAPMVRALIEGRKTQTRRIAKISAIMGNRVAVHPPEELIELEVGEFRRGVMHYASTGGLSGPYTIGVAVGDRLWVREAWRTSKVADELKPSELGGGGYSRIWYELDRDNCDQHGRYRHARFMPRWASRLTLTVTDVRVERLQDCSRDDAIAEGIQRVGGGMLRWENWSGAEGQSGTSPQAAYALLWNSINGAGAWDANPWVVAVTFTVEQRNIDA